MKRFTLLVISACISLWADDSTVLFQPSWDVGPFPTDALTSLDSTQATGRKINLTPPANCGNPALSACTNTALLNQLDGFSINPQIVVCFSAPADPNTLA